MPDRLVGGDDAFARDLDGGQRDPGRDVDAEESGDGRRSRPWRPGRRAAGRQSPCTISPEARAVATSSPRSMVVIGSTLSSRRSVADRLVGRSVPDCEKAAEPRMGLETGAEYRVNLAELRELDRREGDVGSVLLHPPTERDLALRRDEEVELVGDHANPSALRHMRGEKARADLAEAEIVRRYEAGIVAAPRRSPRRAVVDEDELEPGRGDGSVRLGDRPPGKGQADDRIGRDPDEALQRPAPAPPDRRRSPPLRGR